MADAKAARPTPATPANAAGATPGTGPKVQKKRFPERDGKESGLGSYWAAPTGPRKRAGSADGRRTAKRPRAAKPALVKRKPRGRAGAQRARKADSENASSGSESDEDSDDDVFKGTKRGLDGGHWKGPKKPSTDAKYVTQSGRAVAPARPFTLKHSPKKKKSDNAYGVSRGGDPTRILRKREKGDWSEGTQSDSDDDLLASFDDPRVDPRKSSAHRVLKGVMGHDADGRKEHKKESDVVQSVQIDESLDWTSLGGMQKEMKLVKEAVMLPLLYPGMFASLGVKPPRGLLFHGPPGTGKTLMVKCLAGAIRKANLPLTLFLRKGADILSKWVGEGERQLRLLFDEARKQQPSIIFFDEIDGIAPVRAAKNDQVHSSIVATLLALMDGLEDRGQVIVIGATNRPDAVDTALRRPGRFDRELLFGLPDTAERLEILKVHTKAWPQPPHESFLEPVAAKLVACSGADISAVCTEAALGALRRTYPQIYREDAALVTDPDAVRVTERDFAKALRTVKPTLARQGDLATRELPPHLMALFRPLVTEIQGRVRTALVKSERLCLVSPADADYSTQYVVPSALHGLRDDRSDRPVTVVAVDYGSQAATEVSAHITRQVETARQRAPAVLYLPRIDIAAKVDGAHVALWGELAKLPPDSQVVLVTTAEKQMPPRDVAVSLKLQEVPVPLPSEADCERFWVTALEQRFKDVFDQQWETAAEEAEPPKLPKKSAVAEVPKLKAEPGAAAVVDWAAMSEGQIEECQQAEEKYFRLFRNQIRDDLHALIRHPRFKCFIKPVDFEDYSKYVKEPLCLEGMQKKNNEEQYEDLETVRRDYERIADNAIAYLDGSKKKDDIEVKVRTYASEFKDTSLLKLDCFPADVVQEWDLHRARRSARAEWKKSKESKDAAKDPAAKPEPRKDPAAKPEPKPREQTRTKARALSGTCGDVLPMNVQNKLRKLGLQLTPVLRARTSGDWERDGRTVPAETLVKAALGVLGEVAAATDSAQEGVELPVLEACLDKLFELKMESEPMSSFAAGAIGGMLEDACDEFCVAVRVKLNLTSDAKAKAKPK